MGQVCLVCFLVSHVLDYVSLYVDVLGWDGTCG